MTLKISQQNVRAAHEAAILQNKFAAFKLPAIVDVTTLLRKLYLQHNNVTLLFVQYT